MDISHLHTAGRFPHLCSTLGCVLGTAELQQRMAESTTHFLNDTLVSQLLSLKKISEMWAIKICLGAQFYMFQAMIRPTYTLFAGLWLGLPNQGRLVWERKIFTSWWEADESYVSHHPTISFKFTCQWPKDLLLDLEDGSSGKDN